MILDIDDMRKRYIIVTHRFYYDEYEMAAPNDTFLVRNSNAILLRDAMQPRKKKRNFLYLSLNRTDRIVMEMIKIPNVERKKIKCSF